MEEKELKPDWMSIGQAVKYLNVSKDTLRRWEKRGRLINLCQMKMLLKKGMLAFLITVIASLLFLIF